MHIHQKKGFIAEIKSVIQYILPYKKEVTIAIIALIFSSSSVLLLSHSVKSVIDKGISAANQEMLSKSIIYTLFIITMLSIATAVRFYFITYVGEKVIANIRRQINDKILVLSPVFFESNKTGDLLTQLSSDTTTVYNIISSSLSIIMRNIVMLIGSMILMISTSIKLTSIIMLVIPVLILLVRIISRTTRKLSKESQDKVAELVSITDEIIHNIKTIQAYVQESYEQKRFENKLSELLKISLSRITARALLTFALIICIFSTVSITLWIGSTDVIDGNMSAGQLSSFIFLTIVSGASLVALSETINNIQKAAGVSERITNFLNQQSDIENSNNNTTIINNNANINLNNITFYYTSKPNKPVLNNISISFLHGKTTAIVGESGAGKSTIMQLLLRFYDPTSGSIAFGDQDISKIDLFTLRNQFAYVSQDAAIFSASVYDNICYSNPNATQEEVMQAANMAAAMEFIDQLPNGFNTFVGEKGVRLSGGQKQRIAIARAILKNSKILLLDEATSSLDSHNELLVQQGLNYLMNNRTCIIIAHRLSTIKNAHNIIVIKDGGIYIQGSHNELLKNSYYAKLYKNITH